jgi:putative phosphoribosyl transferase
VRKLGLPIQPELAMGAIASGGAQYVDRLLIDDAGVTPIEFERVLEDARLELAEREQLYRQARPPVDLTGRIVIVVDDGIVCALTPRMFFSVGQFYADFSETTHDDVCDLLARGRRDAG